MKTGARRTVLFLILFLLGTGLWLTARTAAGQSDGPTVLVMDVQGPVAPAMQLYIDRGLQLAADRGYALVVMQLNTPGGSLEAMRIIVENIRASQVPVAVYITPRGAWAASAGTLITLAGHVSAMAPETTIGAASPVGSQGEEIETTEATKVKEVLKASARNLAANRPAGAIRLAEEMIDKARAVSVREAVEAGLVDLQVENLAELLSRLDGRTLSMPNQQRTLQLKNAQTVTLPQTLIEQGLQIFTDPNLVFIFLSAGIWAIIIEISSPGGWVAGFTGAVLLLLAFFGMGILPVNWVGLLFLALSFLLFILDIKAPTHGALTAAGAGSFIVGALILFNTVRVPGFPTISVPLVVGTGLFIAASFFAALLLALRAQAAPVMTGQQTMIGRVGSVRQAVDPRGQVQLAGELWTARLAEGAEPLQVGERAEVVAVEGVQLRVKRAD